ncbi:MAG: hypothetical protein QXX30_01785 [Candidatus Aenigmatarchaeota archaeon]
MEIKDIADYFKKDKIFITPEAASILANNVDFLDKIREQCIKDNIFIITTDFLKNFFDQQNFSVKIEIPEEVREFSVEDVVLQLKNRLEFLSSVLIQNNQLKEVYSISRLVKAKKDFEKGTVIGMIKDKTTYTFTLEDLSGSIIVRGEANDIEKLNLDEVIGVELKKDGETFVVNKFFYPSFSFFRKIQKLSEDVIFSCENFSFRGKNFDIKMNEGAKISIGDVKILLLKFNVFKSYAKGDYLESACLLLEKRHVNPTVHKIGKIYKDDFFLLKEIPEYFIIVGAAENLKKIYKGVQIYFLKEGSFLNLKEGRFL